MRTEEEMVVYALETEPALLPHMPELLADLEELGSDAEAITEIIDELGLPADARVIDLGSGKGAVAIEIAEELAFNVVGIELFEPFVVHSQEAAQARGVAERCTFIQGDVAKLAGKIEPADVIVFAALGDVLGPLRETMAIIRQYVKPGGYMVISDDYIKEGKSSDFPGFEYYADHTETIARLTSSGDTLVREVIESGDDDEGNDDDQEESALIQARAEALAARHPEIADAVLAYAEDQAAEYEFIAENLVEAIWVLKRS